MIRRPPSINRTRRRLLGAAIASGSTFAVNGWAQTSENYWAMPRALWLQRPETGEEARVVYWQDGRLLSDGYSRACTLLRDVRANQAVQMDLTLLDVICGAQGWFRAYGYDLPFTINSGYRTIETNRLLLPEGAAHNSLHTVGRACDGRVAGVPTEYLGRLALYLRGGGVGIYLAKSFVHMDTGRLRAWRG